MSIWKDHFGSDILLRWDVFNWIITSLTAVAAAAITIEYYESACVCIGIAGAIAIWKFLSGSIYHPASVAERVAFAVVMTALVAAIAISSIYATLAYKRDKGSAPVFTIRQGDHFLRASSLSPEETTIIVEFNLANTGTAKGTISSLDMLLTVDGRTYSSERIVPPNKDLRFPVSHDAIGHSTFVLPGYKFWTHSIQEQAIAPHTSAVAWTFGKFQGLDIAKLLNRHAILTLKLTDVEGRTASSDSTLKGEDAIPSSQMPKKMGTLTN